MEDISGKKFCKQILKERLALDDSKRIHLQQHTECLYMKQISETFSQNFECHHFNDSDLSEMF